MKRSSIDKKRLAVAIAFASVTSSISGITLAQESNALTLEEIIVTAQKREQNLQDIPIAVTAYSAAEMENAGIATIIDLEKSVPNTQMRASRGTNSTLTAFIRGIGQQDPLWGFEPGVGIYVDDVYIARPQAAVLDVFDVERIEVLRGPQGTLYGKNTIGGAVKYVTKSLEGEAQAKIKVAIGEYGQQDIMISGQMPIIEDTLYIGAAINRLERDGYGTQYKDYDSATGTFGRTEENYNKDVLSARFSIEYAPTDSFSLKFSADSTDDDSNNRCGSRFATNTVAGPNGEFFDALPNPYDSQCGMTEKSNVESEGFSLSASYDINENLSIKYIYADREGNTETFIDFDGTPLDSFEVPAFYKDDQQTHELQANYIGDGFSLVGGIYYYEGNAAGAFDALFGQFSTGVLTGSQFSNAVFGDVDTESTSFYINGDVNLTDRLTLTAGVRYTNDEKAASVNRQFVITSNSIVGTTTQGSGLTFGNAANDTLLAIRTDFNKNEAKNDWSETSPSLKLSFDVNDDTMVYAGWSKGFKSGGFDMRADAAVEPNAVEGYDPETVDTYEIGIKTQLLDDRVRLNLTAFQSDFKDMQVTVQAPAPAPAFFSSTVVNAGEAEIDGIEFEATGQVTESLSAKLVVGYLNAEFIEVNDAVFGNVAEAYDDGFGNTVAPWEMQNSPDWNGQLGLNYSTDLGGAGSLIISTAVSYRDSTRMFDQTASILDQKAYSLWDASAVWHSSDEAWTAALHIKNISDKEYRTGGYNFPATAGEDAILGFYGAPRTWTASVAYQF
jgi:iron complex outermembrane receptor protein